MLAKRPILIGGLGLSASLWLLQTVHIGLFDSSTLLSAIALGSGIWWWRHGQAQPQPQAVVVPRPDRAAVDRAMATLERITATLTEAVETTLSSAAQASWQPTLTRFRQQTAALKTHLDRDTLQVGLLGDPRSGKSALLAQLEAQLKSHALETDADKARLTFQEFALPDDAAAVSDALVHQDALLFLTPGDLTDSAYTWVRQRLLDGQRVVLVFSKQDQYTPADRETVLQQLQQRALGLPLAVPVVAIAADPRPLKVRRHQADGQFEEWLEPVAPDLTALTLALQTLQAERTDLVLATTLRQSETLRRDIQGSLNQVRREQAMPIVEQLQWVAAGTAFASPVPTLDLLAAIAVNAQLIMDLGKVYGFNLSLEEAKTAAGTLASLTVKLGLVELSTQALTTVLKSHAATFVAGGLLQGLSAAYLTRLAGLSLIEYFEAAALAGQTAPTFSWEGIGQRLQTLFQQGGQGPLLVRLVQQGLERLRPATEPSVLQGSQA